jgi:hypothetical protein
MSHYRPRHMLHAALCCLGGTLLSFTPTAAEVLPIRVETQQSLSIDCVGNLDFGTIWRRSGYAGNASVAVAAADGASAEATGSLVVSGGSSVPCSIDGATAGAMTATLSGGDAVDRFDARSGTLSGVKLVRAGGGELLANVTVAGLTGGTFHIGGVLAVATENAAPAGTYTSEPITITVTDDGVPP